MSEKKFLKTRDRRNTNCSKWDGVGEIFGKEDLLPLWVADMDFECPECIQESLHKYVNEGIYGYYLTPKEYYESFINWQKRRNQFEINSEWIRYSTGIVTALYWFINILSNPKDSVLILTPCYYPFMDAVIDTGRTLVKSELVKDENDYYTIDFDDFENKIVENDVKVFLLCSPHNPVGRCWKKEELRKLVDICKKYNVYIVSDEIHSDLIMPGNKHIVTYNIASDYEDHIVTAMSGSKTFNLAGTSNSYIIIKDLEIRKKFDQFIKNIRVIRGASFGYVAQEAGFRGGEAWLEEVIDQIHENYEYLKEQLSFRLPKAKITPLEATYLTWVDLGEYVCGEEIIDKVVNECKLGVDFGAWFLSKERNIPDTHIRINIATSKENIEEAIKRLVENLA